nr:MAG TPA: hypothetical protein [Bacteriophage sp.]
MILASKLQKNRQNAKSTANYSSHMRAKFILHRRG